MRLKRLLLLALPLLLLLSLAVGAPAQGPPGIALEQLGDIVAAQERATPGLLLRPGVVGTGVGVTGNGQGVLEIYVEDPSITFPRRIEGVRARTVVTGPIFALQGPPCGTPPCGGGGGGGGGDDDGGDGGGSIDPTSHFARPVPIGVSTGHPDITAGTIGARLTDGTNVFALSNNHVYANENRASLGDPVIQPGTFDGGTSPDDDIGNLHTVVPLDFSGDCVNRVDAAMASSETTLLDNATPADGYGTPASNTVSARLDQPVMKYGRTTGLTAKKVTSLNVTVNVRYDEGVACFTGQFAIRGGNFSSGGDSGSLIVDESTLEPVGLLFAGSNSTTIANPIIAVLNGLGGVSIDGS